MSDSTSTPSLLYRFSEGDPAALGELSDMFSPALLGFATRLLSEPFLARDIVQDVYIKLWEKRTEAFDSLEGIKKYLFVATRNACFNQNEKYRVRHGQAIVANDTDADEAMRKLILSEYMGLIYQIVSAMPEKLQQVFYLSFEDGLQPEEIAERLNIPKQTIKNRKVEVYKALRDGLKHYKVAIPLLLKMLFPH
ncbi:MULTISPECIES: RNA polymerase sigma factor [Niastella]|uniref:Sigma-70 family RNA polymerase sigma factor n=1 Tax=Niastella soli TaxID=2821487 RepID=A0ABS3YYC7_9BACT|nr:sigma-70 family RNA polymerase sigma factor [Niastella soli]MBO9202926.1 sigma-70 family RNA polymerase sigma factor [Niastella soli]